MSNNLLRNGSFEADWSEEQSHLCFIFPVDGQTGTYTHGRYEMERGESFNPPGWITFCLHGKPVAHDTGNPVGWAMPEVRVAPRSIDERRVRTGENGLLMFTFFRVHDCGLVQEIQVQPGTKLRLSVWAHAWSSTEDNALHSNGVGTNAFYAEEGDAGISSDQQNFTFRVGIDPAGGTNPYAESVVWGKGAHIYNTYAQVPPVEATAPGSTVTVFLHSRCLWPFKHNDAYFDDAVLEVVGTSEVTELTFEPSKPQTQDQIAVTVTSTTAHQDVSLSVLTPGGDTVPTRQVTVEQPLEGKAWRWTFTAVEAGEYRAAFAAGGGQPLVRETIVVEPKPVEVFGLPREQYARTYVLLPSNADRAWVEAILNSGAWEKHRWTIGGSADDAGLGALEDKTVIAVNPNSWPSDLRAFFQKYYPRTHYAAITAATPGDLERELKKL